MTQTRTHIPFVFRAYRTLVATTVTCYIACAVLPFGWSGAWRFSRSRILEQRGVPGYPLDSFGVLVALISGLFVPAVSLLPLLFLASLLARGEFAPLERRALLPALLVHILFVAFALSYGQTILAWIFD